MTILIADNSQVWRDFAKTTFPKGVSLIECPDGEEVLAAFDRHRPHWVLMDIQMDKMDGLTAARLLRERFPGARIIFVTQFGDADLRAAAAALSVEGYVLKDDFSRVHKIIAKAWAQETK